MADVKELFDNEELVANIAEDIEELPEEIGRAHV